MAEKLSYREYYDWWLFSGIGVGEPFHAETHAILKRELSGPGVVCILAADLLEMCSDHPFSDCDYRFEAEPYPPDRLLFADAVEQIGANRLAEHFRRPIPRQPTIDEIQDALEGKGFPFFRGPANPQAGFDSIRVSEPDSGDPAKEVETYRELRNLLKAYVSEHEPTLQADIKRHGDPRTEEGFNRRKARKERDHRNSLAGQREYIRRKLPEMREVLEKAKEAVESSDEAEEIRQRVIRVQNVIERFESYDRENLTPEAKAWFAEAEALVAQNSGRPQGKVDETVHRYVVHEDLHALGAFTVDEAGGPENAVLEWDTPVDLNWLVDRWTLVIPVALASDERAVALWKGFVRINATLAEKFRESLRRGFREGGIEALESPEKGDVLDEVSGMSLELQPDYTWMITLELEAEDEHGWEMYLDENGNLYDHSG